MIPVLFVGDGERDAVTIPRLVEQVLAHPIRAETHTWAHLHKPGESGYRRKLRFALIQAQDAHAVGIVAVVDADKGPKGVRLRELRKARDALRAVTPPFPTALGEAVPHGEAWLLDDPVAVRRVLVLEPERMIPTVRQEKQPKVALETLWKESKRGHEPPLEVWADIARQVDPSRYAHARETGFHQFAEDIRDELASILK